MKITDLDDFTRHYLIAALWSSTDDAGDSLDWEYGLDDFAPEAIAKAVIDCTKFQQAAAPLLAHAYPLYQARSHTPQASAGHDFWLTRNGRGAGFWDRGFGELGEKLSALCQDSGSDCYVGDDGKAYLS